MYCSMFSFFHLRAVVFNTSENRESTWISRIFVSLFSRQLDESLLKVIGWQLWIKRIKKGCFRRQRCLRRRLTKGNSKWDGVELLLPLLLQRSSFQKTMSMITSSITQRNEIPSASSILVSRRAHSETRLEIACVRSGRIPWYHNDVVLSRNRKEKAGKRSPLKIFRGGRVCCAAREHQTRPIGVVVSAYWFLPGRGRPRSNLFGNRSRRGETSSRDPGTNYSRKTALKRSNNSVAASDFPIRMARADASVRGRKRCRSSC